MSMQSHVYGLGLKLGQCSDVKLRAFDRVYKLHRLFLIQSGFFRAMLCGGYAEDVAVAAAASSRGRPYFAEHSRTGSDASEPATSNDAGIINLHFDDPNIGRAAFEYCIAHLYGGGPQLVLPYWASPSSAHPLSPAFALEFSRSQSVAHLENQVIGPQSHPATPRFLLSLLATSIYLNIPSITSQALTLILCSMTPYTVSYYLRFAIGKGIEGAALAAEGGDEADEWDWELEGPIRTLEDLGIPVQNPGPNASQAPYVDKEGSKATDLSAGQGSTSDAEKESGDTGLVQGTSKLSVSAADTSSLSGSTRLKPKRGSLLGEDVDEGAESSTSAVGKRSSVTRLRPSADTASSAHDSFGGSTLRDRTLSKETITSGHGSTLRASRGEQQLKPLPRQAPEMPDFHYGLPADRIGEACACWLARWGLDIVSAENLTDHMRTASLLELIDAHRHLGELDKLSSCAGRIMTGEIDLLGPSLLPRGDMPNFDAPLPMPYVRVWSYPAMPSSWVRAVISSDSFFVRSEWDRYIFAKRIVEMRRLQKEQLAVIDNLLWNAAGDVEDEVSDADSEGEHAFGSSDQPGPSSPPSQAGGFGSFGLNQPHRRHDSSADREEARSRPRRVERNRLGSDSASSRQDFPESEANEGVNEDEDENEYTQLFSSGIYYTHMSFQELNKISADLSPSTGRPYTPLSVLQAALWAGSELKNHVLSCARGSRAPSLPTLDGEVEGALDGSWAANSSLESNNSVQIPPSTDGSVDLGVASSLHEFQQACEAAASARGWKKGSTPLQQRGSHSLQDPSLSTQSLGGRGATPLLTGSSGGSDALLSKRYYLVPSDDTVRLGDGLLSICGQANGVQDSSPGARPSTGAGLPSDPQAGGRAASPTPTSVHALGATGNAAGQLPNTVPLPNPPPMGEAQAPNALKKDRQHFFGVANAVATGRELGSKHSRTPVDPSKTGGRDDLPSRSQRSQAPSLRQFGSLPPEGDDASGRSDYARDEEMDETADGYTEEASPFSTNLIERWTGYEPMRLGVEFNGVDLLPEKQRLYSPTFFYAGSIWNLYVQAIKKAKGIQLGIYLHRQSPNESLPQPSAPFPTSMNASSPSRQSQDGHATVPDPSAGAHDLSELDTPSRNVGRNQMLVNRLQAGSSSTAEISLDHSGFRPQESVSASSLDGSVNGGTGDFGRNSTQLDGPGSRRYAASSFLDPGTTSTSNRHGGSSPHGTPAGNETAAMGASLTLPNGITLSSLGSSAGSTSSSTIGGGVGGNNTVTGSTTPRTTPPQLSAATGPSSVPIVPLNPGGPPVYQVCPAPAISYRDPRRVLRAYFSIHCPSPFGNALTRFSSAPDYFSLSQSWGWKSSSLLGVAYLENGKLGEGRSESWGTFRCVCTVGVV